MRECGRCGQENSAKARYCNGCGFMLLSALADGTPLDGGRYRIEALIKQGGMGSVYRCRDLRLGRDVALKEMLDVLYHTPEERQGAGERFQQEARLLAGLSHHNLPRVTDFFNESGRHYLAMDFIEGVDLESYLHRFGKPGLDEELVCRWGLDMADVLDYLHGQDPPIIYRDLKPSNIMVRPGPGGFPETGDVALVDFGIARRIYTDTSSRTAVGTEGYAPLEQYQGRLDPRSDIYALGATLYHLLTGKVPTPFRFPPIRRERADVSEGLQAILARCLSLEPEGRFASAALLRESLAQRLKIGDTARLEEGSKTRPRADARPPQREGATAPATRVSEPLHRRLSPSPPTVDPTPPEPAKPRMPDGWTPSPMTLPTRVPVSGGGASLFGASYTTEAGRPAVPAARPGPAPTRPEPVVPAALVVRRAEAGTPAAPTREAEARPRPGQPRDFSRAAEPRSLSPVLTWRDGSSLALVPAGDFWMGSNDSDTLAEADELPQRLVHVDAYYVDRSPITHLQFERFVRDTGYVTMAERRGSPRTWRNPTGRAGTYGKATPAKPHALDNHPVVCVTWDDAQAYCQWAGKRLPTEAEWEKAARGRDARIYPWGSFWDPERASSKDTSREELLLRMAPIFANRGTLPVGCYPTGTSPYGMMDMAGNVCEWVQDAYGPYPGAPYPVEGASDRHRVIRGGSWWDSDPAFALRCARRMRALRDSDQPYLGFRCVLDAGT